VVGNHVVTGDNKTYVPYGISVYGGLEQKNYGATKSNQDAQIKAAAIYWHANTIRLQVAESNLLTSHESGGAYNLKFLRSLEDEVSYAHSLGLAVVINDQTEFTSNSPAPTTKTLNFWKIIARQFKGDGYVIFDLFNEPRLQVTNSGLQNNYNKATPDKLFSLFGSVGTNQNSNLAVKNKSKNNTNADWSVWRNGGTVNHVHYLGMESLVKQIKSTGADNLIWVEGINQARQLPPNQYLLSDDNVVYSIHHPNLNRPSTWERIGALSQTRPVVEGEWAQYASNWAECYSDAYHTAPLYLNYLHRYHIGIIAWSLQPGSLLQDTNALRPTNLGKTFAPTQAADLSTPNKLMPGYKCRYGSGEGVGQLLQTYFTKNSTSYSF